MREAYPSKLRYPDQNTIEQKVQLQMKYHFEKQYIEETDFLPDGTTVADKSIRRWNGNIESVYYPDKKHGTVSQSKGNVLQETLDPFYKTLMDKPLHQWLEEATQTAVVSSTNGNIIIEFLVWKNYRAKYTFDKKYDYLPVAYEISDKAGHVLNQGSVGKVESVGGKYGQIYMPMEYSAVTFMSIHAGDSIEVIPAVETHSIVTSVEIPDDIDDTIFDPHFPPNTDVYAISSSSQGDWQKLSQHEIDMLNQMRQSQNPAMPGQPMPGQPNSLNHQPQTMDPMHSIQH